jgi:hypothetical protein
MSSNNHWITANVLLDRDAFTNSMSHSLTDEEQEFLEGQGYDIRTLYISNEEGTTKYSYLAGKKLVIPRYAIYIVLFLAATVATWI